MAFNKQSNLIASVKMLNIGFINKNTINLDIERGRVYSVLVNYQSFLSNLFPLAPPSYFSLYNINVSFIELYDFMISST